MDGDKLVMYLLFFVFIIIGLAALMTLDPVTQTADPGSLLLGW